MSHSTRQVSAPAALISQAATSKNSPTGSFFVRASLSLSRRSFRDNDLQRAVMGKTASTHHWSEDFALDQLQSKGLRLVERNYRTRRGDRPDLAGRASLVFVEVRYRASSAFGRPEETVDAKKQSRLRFTAEVFLQQYRYGYDTPCRFDVFAVSGKMPDPDWQWIQNAF